VAKIRATPQSLVQSPNLFAAFRNVTLEKGNLATFLSLSLASLLP
jgi:hypothetical protein